MACSKRGCCFIICISCCASPSSWRGCAGCISAGVVLTVAVYVLLRYPPARFRPHAERIKEFIGILFKVGWVPKLKQMIAFGQVPASLAVATLALSPNVTSAPPQLNSSPPPPLLSRSLVSSQEFTTWTFPKSIWP